MAASSFDLRALAGLLLPSWCPGCGEPDQRLCAGCRGTLAAPAHRVPLPALPHGPPAWACTEHAGVPADLVVAWKERGRHDLVRVLAPVLARAVSAALADAASPDAALQDAVLLGAAPGDGVLLVPVPSSRAARRRRGEDCVRRLALGAATVLRREPGEVRRVRLAAVLRHRRAVADQSGLRAAERRRNLAGALAVPPRMAPAVSGRCCVVVDDIVTTGATAAAATEALVACGAHVTAVAALSATPRTVRLFGDPRRV